MIGRGLINKAIAKCVNRGKGRKFIKRYLYIHYGINITKEALKARYERITRSVSQ